MDFATEFKAARRVSTPIVAIRTFDPAASLQLIRNAFGERLSTIPLFTWDCVRGIIPASRMAEGFPMPEGSTEVFPLAMRVAHDLPADTILCAFNAHFFAGDPDSIQAVWNIRDAYKSTGRMLVLFVSPGSNIAPELAHDTYVIDVPLPTRDEIREIISQAFRDVSQPVPDESIVLQAIRALVGIPAFPAEQSISMSIDKKTGSIDMPGLWKRKRDAVASIRGLSIYNGNREEYGGNEPVKQYIREVFAGKDAPQCVILMDEYEKAFAGVGTDMSGVTTQLAGAHLQWTQDRNVDGLGLVGVTGTGKSALAKWISHEFSIPLILFSMSEMQSSLVGSSGENLRAAYKMVDAISDGKVLMIGTSNGFETLSPEMQNRFTLGIFWVETPDAEERATIWGIYQQQWGLDTAQPLPVDQGWTGREIRECAYKAFRLGISLQAAAKYIVPVTRSNADKIHQMRTNASGRYLSASKGGTYEYQQTKPSADSFPVPTNPSSRHIRDMN